MADGADAMTAFRDAAIGPACTDFASRIGSDEPAPLVSGGRVGYKVRLPSSMKSGDAKSVVVCAEEFDDEAFTIKVSRPDIPDQLRQIALVRYEALDGEARQQEEAARIRAAIGESLEQLHQGMTNR